MYKSQVQVQYKYSKPQSLGYPETSSHRYSKEDPTVETAIGGM